MNPLLALSGGGGGGLSLSNQEDIRSSLSQQGQRIGGINIGDLAAARDLPAFLSERGKPNAPVSAFLSGDNLLMMGGAVLLLGLLAWRLK